MPLLAFELTLSKADLPTSAVCRCCLVIWHTLKVQKNTDTFNVVPLGNHLFFKKNRGIIVIYSSTDEFLMNRLYTKILQNVLLTWLHKQNFSFQKSIQSLPYYCLSAHVCKLGTGLG